MDPRFPSNPTNVIELVPSLDLIVMGTIKYTSSLYDNHMTQMSF